MRKMYKTLVALTVGLISVSSFADEWKQVEPTNNNFYYKDLKINKDSNEVKVTLKSISKSKTDTYEEVRKSILNCKTKTENVVDSKLLVNGNQATAKENYQFSDTLVFEEAPLMWKKFCSN